MTCNLRDAIPVLPEPPENLTAVNATSSSIYLHWTVPVSMQNFPRPLEHRVMYCCQYTPKVFQFGGIIERRDAKNVFYNLTNLPYAHNLCDIRVSSRSAVALKTDEKMWSRNASITVRTSSEGECQVCHNIPDFFDENYHIFCVY